VPGGGLRAGALAVAAADPGTATAAAAARAINAPSVRPPPPLFTRTEIIRPMHSRRHVTGRP